MTKYIKHSWKKVSDNSWITTDKTVVEKRHPEAEYAGLGVKIWMKDSDGVDVCLSEIPDSTSAADITEGSKKAVQVLTETQYNTVKTPYFEAETLWGEASELTGDDKTAKETAATAKDTEAQNALNAL
tara:strand:- start:491 stop:874 length:384 start_codon:yes stop_codon:yes gene_type:complete